jgi:uncharacterized glyoxalase superfamily protein PhnB
MSDERSIHPLRELAEQVQRALATGDAAALDDHLDPEVTWASCAGADDVRRTLGEMFAAGPPLDEVSVDTLGDRLVLTARIGEDVRHQAIFAIDGRITEIRDAIDRRHAVHLRPIGPIQVAAARPVEISGAAPVLPVGDIAAAVAHYRSLGFSVRTYEGDAPYAYAERNGVSLHLSGVHGLDPATTTSAVYLYVTDADTLYAQWRLARVDGRLVAPQDTDYGLREGAHIDPDGNLLRFGSPLG